jgi:hypothetical protein
MNKAYVVKFAEAKAVADAEIESLGYLNVPSDAVARVEMRARYTIARDRQMDAERDYEAAFAAWRKAGYPE